MKDFAKSIKTENKAIYDDKGQFIIGYVEKEGSEYVAYTHGITGAKSFLLKASDEKTATDELKDYAKIYWKKQGNKKVGNEVTVLKDGDVWVVLYANETKSKEFDTEAEARAFAKQVGNSKVGNSIYSDLASQYESKLKEFILKKDMDGLNVLINSCESQYKDMKSQSESFYQKYKDADDAAKKFYKIGIDAMNAKRNLK